jgi:hypothetical protein
MRFRLLGPEGAALTGICILGFRACRARPGYSADISAQDSDDARLSVRNAPGFRRCCPHGHQYPWHRRGVETRQSDQQRNIVLFGLRGAALTELRGLGPEADSETLGARDIQRWPMAEQEVL